MVWRVRAHECPWIRISNIACPQTQPRDLAAQFARALRLISLPSNQRAQGKPGARCTRGLVCKMHKEKRTRAYRFSGGSPAFPAQWFYGLYRALLGERIRLVTVAAGLIANRIRLDRFRHRQLGTSNGCRNHTVLPYATTPFVCAPVVRSQAEARPAIPITPDAAASTTSHPASVTIAIRPSEWDGMRRICR